MEIKNPIPIVNIGDPYVLVYKGVYYLYATSMKNGYYCWKSLDLINWSEPWTCYEASDKSFGNKCFWAPEVYEFEGQFYMYYTAHWKIHDEESLRIGVAISDSPEGPFEDVLDNRPMFDFGYGVLDAHILKDGDKNYFYYSRASANNYVDGNKVAEIFVAELGEDYISLKTKGEIILYPEQEWEKRQPEMKQFWNEGPFVIKHEGKYHIMYSANFYKSKFYGLGAAVSDNPLGPFVKYENNPVLSTSDKISGPGHNSVIKNEKGDYYCVYHAHTDFSKGGGNRQVYITPLNFKNDRIYLEHPDILNK